MKQLRTDHHMPALARTASVSTHQMLQDTSVIALMASKGTPTWQMGAKVSNSAQITFFFTPQVTYSPIFSY